MRVTTQMVNDSAIKAGLSPRQTSLLNYINQGNSGNALINAIAKNSIQNGSASIIQRKSFVQMEEAASELMENTNVFLEEENSIFDQAAKSGDTSEIVKQVKKMVEAFNDTVGILEKEGSALNRFYAESLKDVAEESNELLAKVGITLEENGTLSIDKEVLESTDLETLEAVFGKDGIYSGESCGQCDSKLRKHFQSIYTKWRRILSDSCRKV